MSLISIYWNLCYPFFRVPRMPQPHSPSLTFFNFSQPKGVFGNIVKTKMREKKCKYRKYRNNWFNWKNILCVVFLLKILSRNNLEFFDQFVGLAVKGLRSYNTSAKLTREARLDFDILYAINEQRPKNNPRHRVITIYYFVLFLISNQIWQHYALIVYCLTKICIFESFSLKMCLLEI